MSRIPQETIDRINDNADIVDIVSKSVDLKKRGRNFLVFALFMQKKHPHSAWLPIKEYITVLAAVKVVMR